MAVPYTPYGDVMSMIPELLVPAGDMERLSYACAYGADAVYAGVPRYSLRTRENGFVTEKSIQEAVEEDVREGRGYHGLS